MTRNPEYNDTEPMLFGHMPYFVKHSHPNVARCIHLIKCSASFFLAEHFLLFIFSSYSFYSDLLKG